MSNSYDYPVPRSPDDLDDLVLQQVEEGAHLEFKSVKAFEDRNRFKRELPKDASAFANAGGGVLIVGIDEDKGGFANRVQGYGASDIKPSWFEDVLLSTVTPKLPSVEIAAIRHGSGSVFVIHVPLSLSAPHQSKLDKCFHARRERRIDALELYEIELLRLRAAQSDFGVFGGIVIDGWWISILVENKSDRPVFDVRMKVPECVAARKPEMKIFWPGLSVVPARSKLLFRIGTVYECLQDDELAGKLVYELSWRARVDDRERSLTGNFHLAELSGAAVIQDDVERLVSAIEKGFKDLAGAFKSRRP